TGRAGGDDLRGGRRRRSGGPAAGARPRAGRGPLRAHRRAASRALPRLPGPGGVVQLGRGADPHTPRRVRRPLVIGLAIAAVAAGAALAIALSGGDDGKKQTRSATTTQASTAT